MIMLKALVLPCMQEALVTGSLEGLVAPPPKTSTPGPAQAGTPAKTGSGSRAAGKRKLAASAAGCTAPGALLRSVLDGGGPEGACFAWPRSHAVSHLRLGLGTKLVAECGVRNI